MTDSVSPAAAGNPPYRWCASLTHAVEARVAALAFVAAALLAPVDSAAAGNRRGSGAESTAAASPAVRRVVEWVTASADNQQLPFAILDKLRARLFVFDRDARLLGSSPVLLGAAFGDHSVPGIGDRELSAIEPHERTTPAGRFVAEPGRNHQGEDIVWVDYDAAVSMHRVRANNPRERRLERLATPTAADNRISFGCINVPTAFYEGQLKPSFGRSKGIVYVLPDTRPLHEVFGGIAAAGATRSPGPRTSASRRATAPG